MSLDVNAHLTPALAAWALEDASAAPAAAHAHAASCLNCEAALTDRFCARCGQPAATHRLTMRHLLHDIPHSIWHVDKGILYTLRGLLLRPGPTLLGYLRGQRARHFAPLSLLLLVTGIYSFLALKLKLGAAPLLNNSAASAELREAQAHMAESVMHYTSWIYVAMAPLVGLLVRRALRRSGINLAEAIVVALYVTAASNFLSLLSLPLYHWATTLSAYYTVTLLASLGLVAYQPGLGVWAAADRRLGGRRRPLVARHLHGRVRLLAGHAGRHNADADLELELFRGGGPA